MMPLVTTGERDLVDRTRAEFLEMPGLHLTLSQACRLWSLDPGVCEKLFSDLVKERFLQSTRTGFVRRGSGR
jgi:hypothetical protein